MRGQIAAANLFALDKIWDNGFRQITTSNKPIQTAADLKGFKIRVPVSPLWTSMFKALDAAPTSLNFNETYSALQTRIVDGQENPMAIIAAAKLYEVQKYGSLTNHMWDGFWLLANKRAWDVGAWIRQPIDNTKICEIGESPKVLKMLPYGRIRATRSSGTARCGPKARSHQPPPS